jgi:hypothetical protein
MLLPTRCPSFAVPRGTTFPFLFFWFSEAFFQTMTISHLIRFLSFGDRTLLFDPVGLACISLFPRPVTLARMYIIIFGTCRMNKTTFSVLQIRCQGVLRFQHLPRNPLSIPLTPTRAPFSTVMNVPACLASECMGHFSNDLA